MPINRRYRCTNCGHRFNCEVLTKEEAEQYKREDRPVGRIHCPKCNRTEVRDGWE